MSQRKIAVPDSVYDRVLKAANAEGTTVDDLAIRAIERELARRWLVQVERDGQARRKDMKEDQINDVVERSVQEFRSRS